MNMQTAYAKIVQGECRTKLALVLLSRSLSYAKIVQDECRTKLALVLLSRSLSYAKIVQDECRTKFALVLLSRSLSYTYTKIVQYFKINAANPCFCIHIQRACGLFYTTLRK